MSKGGVSAQLGFMRTPAMLLRSLVKTALGPIRERQERIMLMLGRQDARWLRGAQIQRLADAEFQVFSQWGEDGILQYLIHRVPIADPAFVEFGVESYAESNTRFLLCHDNWRGLILDGGRAHLDFIESRSLRWRYQLDARSVMVTRENINDLLTDAGFVGDIGLLSIDIDGNDYWVFEAISVANARIVVIEYNANFGADHAVTVPYRADFQRTSAHYSNLYWGASLPALTSLGARKGYRFVGCNSAGNNAFFVREDVAGDLPALSAREGYVEARFRESRDVDGRLSYVNYGRQRLELLRELELVELPAGETRRIAEIFSLGEP